MPAPLELPRVDEDPLAHLRKATAAHAAVTIAVQQAGAEVRAAAAAPAGQGEGS